MQRPVRLFVSIGALLCLAASSLAAPYKLGNPEPSYIAERQSSFTITSTLPVEVTDWPDHPRISWLDTSSRAMMFKEEQLLTQVRFIPHGPGTIQPPALPIVIGGTNLLLRLPAITVTINPLPEDASRLIVLWNGKPTPPQRVRTGQAVDLEFLEIAGTDDANRAIFSVPHVDLDPVHWKTFKATNFASIEQQRLFPFGFKNHEQEPTTLAGRPAMARRYKMRFLVRKGDDLNGHIAVTIGHSGASRTHLQRIAIPQEPLPPPPEGSHHHSGLIGTWTMSASMDQPPEANSPFTITVDISGQGNREPFEPFDFSRPGFHSTGTRFEKQDDSTVDRWHAIFSQTLLPDGSQALFPALLASSFNTAKDEWQIHELTEVQRLPDVAPPSSRFQPATALGPNLERPILLNLHPAVFAAIGLAPLLPFLAAALARIRRGRDPKANARRAALATLAKTLAHSSDTDAARQVDDQLVPLLREHVTLPPGADIKDISSALQTDAPELAELLDEHARQRFATQPKPVAAARIADTLLRSGLLALLLGLCLLTPAPAQTNAPLADINKRLAAGQAETAASEIEALIQSHPNRPALHYNLAIAELQAGRVAAACAASHTARLLAPFDANIRAINEECLQRLGRPPLPGNALLALRPDHMLTLASLLWLTGFICLALVHWFSVFTWPARLLILAALLVGSLAFWRLQSAYASEQYMVTTADLPRQSAPGSPDYNLPTLEAGTRVRASRIHAKGTHIEIKTDTASFWLPLADLKSIW